MLLKIMVPILGHLKKLALKYASFGSKGYFFTTKHCVYRITNECSAHQ